MFRDPVHDGAADPVLCWDSDEKKWFMFYTNRRANVENTTGVTRVHGTHVGIAESPDYGATWTYCDTANINFREVPDYTHWTPEVIYHEETYHVYLTYVPGIFEDWKHPREIVHLASKDILNWRYEATLNLSNHKIIDACVFQMLDGKWRMWYNNEKDGKSTYYADSPGLYNWHDKGKAIGNRSGEGFIVFEWKGKYWMIVDVWKGLGVYSSDDLINWTRQKNNLLQEPGKGLDDQVKVQHPDMVVSREHAYLYYFTHAGQYMLPEECDGYAHRRSSLRVTELKYKEVELSCNRDKPVHIYLEPTDNREK